jgi:general secretion pathway protein G
MAQPSKTGSSGEKKPRFTPVEVIALAILLAVLGVVLWPQLQAFQDGGKVKRAIADITAIQSDLLKFAAAHDSLPDSLSAVGRAGMLDPWGHPYVYLAYDEPKRRKTGYPVGARRDKLYRPLNSTFDLYSVGKDGLTTPSVSAKVSLDDVVRARDGVVALASTL